jgi:hypothetical protein
MFKKLVKICALLGLVSVVGTAWSQRILSQFEGEGIRVEPVRVAGFRFLSGSQIRLTTPWLDYSTGVKSQGLANLLFDNFEGNRSNPDAPTDGRYGTDCGYGASRWFFGENYVNTLFANDIQRLFSGANGQRATGSDFAWFWRGPGSGSSQQCLIAVVTGENWSDTVAPGLTGLYDGVIYDYGVLESGVGRGYYYANNDLTATGLFHQMPNDGVGGYRVFMAKGIDGSNNLIPADGAQPMLWGTKAGNPSRQGPIQWDDGGFEFGDPDNRNGTLDAGENFDYTYGDCPDPLGAMMAFSNAGNVIEVPPTSYTVTRGVEQGSNDVNKITQNDGNRATVQQRFQFAPTLANAELQAVLVAGAGTPVTATLTVVVRANSLPFGDASCRQEIALRDWNTNAFVVLDSRKPTTADALISLTLSGGDRARFFRASDGRAEVSVRVFHLAPLSPAWVMDVNQVKFDITR